ncbi:uncharacterized protein PHACADRAFT_83001 [Phanerochaete carnosa HHB-10118-sp]|uniref:Uncharacterized protein n=1 Tax=Phanerochaete carnosa (strain HHB-10118-sp) TaxID=650164 RepID=K5VCP3_PHACS|nr:uncharacterized protein PHACADRAFT_83001 [Phanerochaete carnosa HHB-10118-sp]EKM60711.1 hypothetical protein PHACADRAFT_83001 [Phanerochaete carnosa HHB-10118-sp]
MFRAALASSSRATLASSFRTFHTTPFAAESVTDKAKKVAHDVNIKVGKKLAGAIETGEQVTEATKETIANCGIGAGSVKEAADKVNKQAGRGLASTIEKGEDVTEKTKETLGKPEWSPSYVTLHGAGTASAQTKQTAARTAQETEETANVAKHKANQTAAGAREGKEDFKADVQKELRK